MVLLFSYMFISSINKLTSSLTGKCYQFDITKIVIKAHISFYMSKQKLIQKRGAMKKKYSKISLTAFPNTPTPPAPFDQID